MIGLLIVFILGLVVLLVGANWFVDSASSLSHRLGIPDIVIGLTVVAVGTSSPELAVNLVASVKGSSGMAIGNILGSNILNILLILGVTSLLRPVRVLRASQRAEIPLVMLSSFVLLAMANDQWFDGATTSVITRSEGFVLLAFFVIFMVYILNVAGSTHETHTSPTGHSLWIDLMKFLMGLVGLFGGSRLLVDGAVSIAQFLGVSQTIIGLTFVAMGTSLPELATSAVAAWKGNSDIALGNVLGSNIINVFLVLGVTSIIQPLPAESALLRDFLVNIMASFLLFLSTFTMGRMRIDRLEGAIFLVLYIIYMSLIF